MCVITVISGKPAERFAESVDYSFALDNERIYETTKQCTSRKHQINPDDLMSLDATYEFDKNFSQKIEVELCENEGEPCTDFPAIKTKCKQKYISIQLQVVSRNSSASEIKTFSIPSNCECAYSRNKL